MSTIEKRTEFVDVVHLSEFFNKKDETSLEEDLNVLDNFQRAVSTRLHAQLRVTHRFEFDFFHLINQVLIKMETGSIARTDRSLHLLMIYCLNKCSDQYQLFRTGEMAMDQAGEDSYQDLINIAELLDQFRNGLLSLMYRFKEINSQIDDDKSTSAYQNLAPAILSIYVDAMLMLKSKTSQIGAEKTDIIVKKLNRTLCYNIFYLLDSKVKSVFDLLLQLSNLNEHNMKYIFPLVEKSIDCMSKNRRRRDSNIKAKKRVYIRILLTFSKFRLMSSSDASKKQSYLEVYETLIDQLSIPGRIYSFIHKILTKHIKGSQRSPDFMKLLCKINLCGLNGLKIRNFIMFKLTEAYHVLFLKALANKQLKSSGYDKKLFESKAIKKPVANLVPIKPVESKPDESVKKVEEDVESENNNELEFTSDYSIFSYSDEEQEACKNNVVEVSETVSQPVCLTTIPTTTTTNMKQEQPEPTKRYNLRSRSPTRDTISKLDLFRNIFGDERILEEFNKIPQVEPSGGPDGGGGGNEFEYKRDKFNSNVSRMSRADSKFYKLNDLVSIMINEDFFKPDNNTIKTSKHTVNQFPATSTPNF